MNNTLSPGFAWSLSLANPKTTVGPSTGSALLAEKSIFSRPQSKKSWSIWSFSLRRFGSIEASAHRKHASNSKLVRLPND
jgi:hypothetical protein